MNSVIDEAKQTYGVIPNFFKETNTYTAAPSAVYMIADEALVNGVLSRREQQAVLLELARYHNSRYDAIVHARMALDAGLGYRVVNQLLSDEPVDDARLQALVETTRRSCNQRGWLTPKELRALEKNGVSRGELYEIFAFIGMKKMTSYTHHIADFDVEAPLKPLEAEIETLPEPPDTSRRQRLFMG